VVVAGGIEDGDQVVTLGLEKLAPDQAVRVAENK